MIFGDYKKIKIENVNLGFMEYIFLLLFVLIYDVMILMIILILNY